MKKTKNRQERMKSAKKEGLKLWSQVVRKRDGKCVMCGKTEMLQAHHWLFRRSHSIRLSLDPDNGVTLCYGCHIGRIHHDGDGDFILKLAEKMTRMIAIDNVEQMREIGYHPTTVSLEEIEAMVDSLRSELAVNAQVLPATNLAEPKIFNDLPRPAHGVKDPS